MADEPRRSGRSTKGQHKNLDMVSDTPKKGKSKLHNKDKAAKTSAEPTPGPSEGEDEEEIIRCICGEYEEEEDVERDMICCDQCLAWQHNDCMGLQFAKGQEPDQYFCEQCRPQNHKDLLERMERGERPWEEVAERRRKEAEEKKHSRRKKGKKGGRRGRPSEARTDASTPTRGATSTTPAPAASATAQSPRSPVSERTARGQDTPGRASEKRKFDEDQEAPQPESRPKSKQPKISPPEDAPMPDAGPTAGDAGPSAGADAEADNQSGEGAEKPTERKKSAEAKQPSETKRVTPVKKEPSAQPSQPDTAVEPAPTKPLKPLEEITNPARKNVAKALVNLFVDQITSAQKQKSYRVPEGKTVQEVAQQHGLAVEDAMYDNICAGSGEPTDPYKQQLRTILFNVKKNTSLRDRLLVGSLSADALSKMSSQDMASDELQQKDAEIKREAERQHIIVQEQGPRIRRTHKGEELIEDDVQNVASEPVFSTAPRRNVDNEASPGSGSPGSPTGRQAGEKNGSRRSSKAAERKTHDEHFPSRGHSPGGTSHDAVFPEVATNIREPVPTSKAQADAEIDQLLRDDEPDSPPYSPKDFHDEGSIWRGKVVMNPVADFTSSAKHVGGADLSGRIPWSQLVPPTLLVDGRIDIQLASNYLCGLRFSNSTDVTVISISSPESPRERASFDRLFNYFQDRKRYGVIGKHPLPAVKDTYMIPIEAGMTKKPEFIELLENNSLEDPTPARVLLVVFAVKTGDSNPPSVQPPSHQPSQEPGAAAAASPLTAVADTPQQAQFLTPGPRAASQISATSTSSFPGSTPAPQFYNQTPQAPQYSPHQPLQAAPIPALPVVGLPAAVQVLGPQATSPSIQELLRNAPNADVAQLAIVRDILQRRPETANDYDLLMQEIRQATAAANSNGAQHHAS
ncbi:putative PHD finger domain protein [Aspergillus candidus]|uniref:Transcription factor BYE1 n=1 Tax=Aspergillus candidus TaxID=41067 RepID=A0A2I2FG70_ASPCN|nr:PHD finger domain protein [Aspergillus candidus]PLB39622.1 PHD finger domain protein [Aspergillus candidus]